MLVIWRSKILETHNLLKQSSIEHFKDSIYSSWKELSNAISIVSIRVDLTFETIKNIYQLSITNGYPHSQL
jgi:hypothetical protein